MVTGRGGGGSKIFGIDLSHYHSGQHRSHLVSPRNEHDPP